MEYRFEMVMEAANTLNHFSQELERLTPPNVPNTITSTRGWSIRFEAIAEYSRDVSTADLEFLAGQLAPPIEILTSYVWRWDQYVSEMDPLLQIYQIMPGDQDTVDSVRVLLDRASYVQRIALSELRTRSENS